MAEFARQYVVSGGSIGFYFGGAVRIVFGLILVVVAPRSRAPGALRVLGFVIVAAGVITALTGLVGMNWAAGVVEGWVQRGPTMIRLTCLLILALGGFVAYACTPLRSSRSIV